MALMSDIGVKVMPVITYLQSTYHVTW